MRPLHIMLPVWGESYTESFLELSLPYVLSAGNMRDVRHPGDWKFRVYTSGEDALTLAAHPAFAQLKEMVAVEIVTIGQRAALMSNPFGYQTAAYWHEAKFAAAAGAGIYLMSPDTVISRGSLVFVESVWAAGFRCMLTIGAKALLEPFAAALRAENAWPAQNGSGISSAVLARLTLDQVHPWTSALTLDRIARGAARQTAGFYARLGPGTLGGMTWLAHPAVFDPQCLADGIDFSRYGTVDLVVPGSTTLDKNAIYYSCDSEEYLVTEYSTMSKALAVPTTEDGNDRVPPDAELARHLAQFFANYFGSGRRTDLAIETFKRIFLMRSGPLADVNGAAVQRLHAIREATLELVATLAHV